MEMKNVKMNSPASTWRHYLQFTDPGEPKQLALCIWESEPIRRQSRSFYDSDPGKALPAVGSPNICELLRGLGGGAENQEGPPENRGNRENKSLQTMPAKQR